MTGTAATSLPATDVVVVSAVFGGDHFRDQSGPAAAAAETGAISEASRAAAVTAASLLPAGGE
ncbi:hypothetical protein ACIQBJ_05810 [Kitasatospora sp. NPDC088391]|uniref:hypothetical protein n=1 Tax=Kitasatospora sp. NPDC088391 TaxID=3364074 RepID=UPI0037F99836